MRFAAGSAYSRAMASCFECSRRGQAKRLTDWRRSVCQDGYGLDLDQRRHARERIASDEGAGREVVRKILLADLDELVSVARVGNEDRHRDEVAQLTADFAEGLAQALKDAMGLAREIACER